MQRRLPFQMPLLESFIYVSTSYCQCGEAVLEERAYQTSEAPESVIQMVNTMTDDVLKMMTPKLLGDQPNTYAYSKALCEDVVSRCGLPVGVVRPSIGKDFARNNIIDFRGNTSDRPDDNLMISRSIWNVASGSILEGTVARLGGQSAGTNRADDRRG